MIALEAWPVRRMLGVLVAWWVVSNVALAWQLVDTIPIDQPFSALSADGLRLVGVTTVALLAPGFLVAGWKALLVAAGRSSIRTQVDHGLIILFALWAVGLPLVLVSGLA